MDTFFISRPIILIISLAINLACISNKLGENQDINDENTVKSSVLHSVTKEFHFSSLESKDLFKIELMGEDILNSQVKFEILDSEMKLIYEVSFGALELLGYQIKSNANKNEKEDFIISRLNHFFDQTNFIEPAIDTTEYDPEDYDLIDISIWNQIKKDGSIGFYYILGEEDMVWIVFLKTSKKIIKYKSCC
jgi:hypothetical protein